LKELTKVNKPNYFNKENFDISSNSSDEVELTLGIKGKTHNQEEDLENLIYGRNLNQSSNHKGSFDKCDSFLMEELTAR
jgi:hypothetical protein